ncbi:MAG: hypothetical protein CMJ42_12760 [Phyllobacteriaceae bacterium]|nr:hypothetical protein [Phyllobacteriaceae bacterium]MBA91803.1 hypothetical protein [Phyllobacteriaceae bacterium]
MKRTLIAALAMQCAWLAHGHAAPAYDRNLEEAAKRMVAERIGDVAAVLRGTFDAGQKPEYSVPQPRSGMRHGPSFRPVRYRGFSPAVRTFRSGQVSVDRVILTGSVIPQE